MKTTALALIACLAIAGCETDSSGDSGGRGRSGGDGDGSAGSGSNLDFGNSDAPQPPPPAENPTITGDGCKAGHYIGYFNGMYRSPAAFEFPVAIESVDLAADPIFMTPAKPGMEFWLEAKEGMPECSEDQEFCFDFSVEGGVIRGQANGLFPFEVNLTGDLDCTKGTFQGVLENGWYEVFGVRYMFDGWMNGSYDASQASFFDGTWAVTEPMGLTPDTGGEGEWHAGWVMD